MFLEDAQNKWIKLRTFERISMKNALMAITRKTVNRQVRKALLLVYFWDAAAGVQQADKGQDTAQTFLAVGRGLFVGRLSHIGR